MEIVQFSHAAAQIMVYTLAPSFPIRTYTQILDTQKHLL